MELSISYHMKHGPVENGIKIITMLFLDAAIVNILPPNAPFRRGDIEVNLNVDPQ